MKTTPSKTKGPGASAVTPELPPGESSGRGTEGIPDPLRFGEDKRQWFVGVICATLGTTLAVGFLVRMVKCWFDPTLAQDVSLQLLPGVAFGFLFAYVGFYFLLWKDQISLDRTSRAYRRKRGWGPWAKVEQGNFSDFDCIRLWLATNKSGQFWHASLHGKAGSVKRRPFDLFKYGDPKQAETEASRLAAALEIVVDTSAVTERNRTEALANERARVWKKRLRPYWIGLVTIVILLIINSLVPGLHWRDGWTDERGRVFDRHSTLFHTLTRVDSAARPLGYSDVKWFVVGHSTRNSGFFTKKSISTSPRLNYRWSIGVGPFPPREGSIRKK